MKTVDYKGFKGSIEFNENDALFHGKIMDIDDLVSYEGKDEKELEEDFQGAVDDYLRICEKLKKQANIL